MKTRTTRLLSRREFLATSAAVGATLCLPRIVSAAVTGKKTFTILHTNDLHSNFIGMAPAADYTPFALNNDTPDLLPPTGTMDKRSVATGTGASGEIKEWQAIMDHLRALPAKDGELPVIPVDERASEVRAIKVG